MSRLYDATRNAYRRVRGLPLPQLVLIGHMDHTRSVAFLPDGNQVINPDDDGSIRARRVEDGEEVGTVMREKGLVLAVAASSDGHWIATGGRAKKVTIWNATTHEKVVEMTGHTGWVRSLAFSPDSARVASGSDDKTVIVWSTTTGERLAGPLEGHTYAVDCVQFSPDGDRIASCDYRDLRIWYSHVGELVIPPIQGEAWSLAWTPDGQQLIAGCYSGYITFIDTSTGSKPAEWKGHTHYVDSISLSHDGNFFASGSWDKTVRLWDTSTQQQIGPALQHDSYVHSVAISPDGHHLVSGDDDKLYIWHLKGVVPKSLLGNTPTNPFVNVHEEDWKEVPSPPSSSQEVLDTQNDKDCDKHGKVGMKDNPEGVDTALQRRTSETSSLRRFLDCPAMAPIGGAVDSSEQLYDSFFNNDLPDAPPPIDEPPKKQFSKFRQKFTWKKKDMKRPMQPEDQLAVAGADTEPAIDPLLDTTLKELSAKDNRKQNESDPGTGVPAEDTNRAFTPTPQRKPAISANCIKDRVRNGVTRIRQATGIMQRERQEHAYIAKLQDRTIFASVRGPPLDEIERGCCFHFLSYIFYGQRDPNINPRVNDTQPNTQLSPSGHGVAKTNLRSLGARLNQLLVRLHLRKPPPPSASASPIIPPTSSPHVDPNSASTPATVPLPNQCPPAIAITSPVNTTEAPVGPSEILASPSQTSSPPAQDFVSSESVDPNIGADGAPLEIEPKSQQLTATERVDQASQCMELPPASVAASHSVTIQLVFSPRGDHAGLGVAALAPIPLCNQAPSAIAITSPTDVLVQVRSSPSAPTSVPISNQSPTIVTTSPVNTTEAPIHISAITLSPSQTLSPPIQVLVAPESVDLNVDTDGLPSEIEPNPWQLTDTERVDSVFVEYTTQLDLEDPWRNS